MGRPPNRPRMLDVELVDDEGRAAAADGWFDAAGPSGRPAPPGRARPARGRLPHRFVAATSVLAAVGITAALLQAGAPDTPSGLVPTAPDLTSPPAETWRVESRATWSIAGDLLMTVDRTEESYEVLATRVTTGAHVWTAQVAAHGVTQVLCPVQVDGPAGPVVVCQARGGMVPSSRPSVMAQDPGRLVVLDGLDGSVVSEQDLEPRHVGIAAYDGDLLSGRYADAVMTVTRTDVATGAEVWSVRLPVGRERLGRTRQVDVREDLVVVTGPDLALLDARDGRLVGTWEADRSLGRTTARDVVVVPHGVGVRPGGADLLTPTVWYGPDGGTSWLGGALAEPELSDGSEPDVVLTVPSGIYLRGLDVARDTVLWSVRMGEQVPVLRRSGSVVLAGEGHLRALDLRTGAELWRSRSEALDVVHPVSDGTFVLASGRVRGAGHALSAVSLSDGSLLWRVPMPEGTTEVSVRSGALVASGPGVVVGLG